MGSEQNKDDLLDLSMSCHSQSIYMAFLLTTWLFSKCCWNPHASFWLLRKKHYHT